MAQALRIASIEVASNPDFVKSLVATPTICWRVAAPFSIREFINHLDRPSVGMQLTVSRSVRRNQPHVWNDRSGHLNPVLPIHGLEKWNLASRVCRTARPEHRERRRLQ